METKSAGYAWLLDQFGAQLPPLAPLAHRSLIGQRSSVITPEQQIETYPPGYRPEPTPMAHLVFALKHEPLRLDVLSAILGHLPAAEIEDHVGAAPSSSYGRRLAFLAEWSTGRNLRVPANLAGAYASVLDSSEVITATWSRNVTRWRVRDNLPGSSRFCPIVRRTPGVEALLHTPWHQRVQAILDDVPRELLHRAVNFLYGRETQSSWAIEREELPADRAGRFIHALERAGIADEPLSEVALTALQNIIVDARYAAAGYRAVQNYVGQSLLDFSVRVHYVCPPPEQIHSLMQGLAEVRELPAAVRAAVVSFGMVYIHPFEDGNGRIHRFLLHDGLARGQIVPRGTVLPISSSIHHRPADYTAALDRFSKPLVGAAKFTLDFNGAMTLHNGAELSHFWRFPDLTHQTEFFAQTLEQTLSIGLPEELRLLRCHDSAREAIRDTVDLPDRRLDLLLALLMQQKGRLSKAKREKLFTELTDGEVAAIEKAFIEAFRPTESDHRVQDEKAAKPEVRPPGISIS